MHAPLWDPGGTFGSAPTIRRYCLPPNPTQPPVLLIEPKPDLGVALQPFVVAGNRLHPDDPAAASKWVDAYLGGMYGSPEAAREALLTSETWEAVKDRVPNLELVYVEDARILVMEDQPERVDAMVAEFVERTEL